jgi:hypothetical protein
MTKLTGSSFLHEIFKSFGEAHGRMVAEVRSKKAFFLGY